MNDQEIKTTEEATKVAEPQIEKVKVGEAEYTQEELSRLVGLGKIGAEAEERYNTKLDRIWPNYVRASQELKELKEKSTAEVTPPQPNAQVSPEQAKEQVATILKEMGFVTKVEAEQAAAVYVQGVKLYDNVNGILASAKADSKPSTDADTLLQYMVDTGVKDPQAAYELYFKPQLKEWEKTQIEKIKPTDVTTQEGSTAGSKQPGETKIIGKEALTSSLRTFLAAQQGSERA